MVGSVDHAGRYFPLTFATLSWRGIRQESADAWLDQCEAAGRAALEQDTPPEEVSGMIGMVALPDSTEGLAEAVWWTDGSAHVRPGRMTLRSLPSAAVYAAMLGAETDGTDGVSNETGLRPGGGRWEATS